MTNLTDTRILPVTGSVQQLVVLLHGLGANGDDLIGLGRHWQALLPGCAFIAPNAPEPCDMGGSGYQWFSLQNRSEAAIIAGLQRARPVLDGWLDGLLKTFKLEARHCALVGFSQGTMLALPAGLQRKQPLAGLLGYAGALYGTVPPNQTPVCLIHGTEDEVIPPTASRFAHAYLHQHHVPASLHLRPGIGHGIDPEGIAIGGTFLRSCFSEG